jgi:hypothetical protein
MGDDAGERETGPGLLTRGPGTKKGAAFFARADLFSVASSRWATAVVTRTPPSAHTSWPSSLFATNFSL